MTIYMQLLNQLTSLGVSVSLDGDELLVRAPPTVITAQLRNDLLEHKAEIVAFLRRFNKHEPVSLRPGQDETLLSYAQQRVWFLQQIEPESAVWNVASVLHLTGRLDVFALERAFSEIVSRHSVLRSTFNSIDGVPHVRIAPAAEWSMVKRSVDHREALQHARSVALEPMDLTAGPLFCVMLLEVNQEEHYLSLAVHHILCDGWSLGLLSSEVSALYNAFRLGLDSPLPEMKCQYADYVGWEHEASSLASQTDIDWWKQKLAGSPPPLELGSNRRRTSVPTHDGRRISVAISAKDTERLHLLARECGVTSFMLFLAAFKVLLFRYTGVEDILIGTASSYRKRREFEQLIGMFANPVVLRTGLSGNPSFRDVLGRVRETVLDAFSHDTIPFDRLIEELHPNRDAGSSPFFQVSFVYQNLPPAELTFDDVHVFREFAPIPHARYDLSVEVWTTESGVRCDFEFRNDLFSVEAIEQMQGHYVRLLRGVLEDADVKISNLAMLSELEREARLADAHGASSPYPDKPIHILFEEQARRNPGAIALIDEVRTVTYGDLNAAADTLAVELNRRGMEPGASIGILIERSVESIVAMLAILKNGGVYLVLDTEYPEERLRFLLQDAGARVVLSHQNESAKRDHWPNGFDYFEIAPCLASRSSNAVSFSAASAPTNDSPMCLLYTSGSTGVPKGVEICHRGLVRLLFSRECLSFGTNEAVLHMAPQSFDASLLEIWGPLVHGGRCVISRDRQPSLPALKTLIEKNGVRAAWLTSSLFNWIVDESPDSLVALERIYTGGEALSVTHIRRAYEVLPDVTIYNGYGPTEATVFTCLYAIPREIPYELVAIPIGKPVANTKAYVLDAYKQLVPVGIPGELYIGSGALALGYRNRPELNAEKFIPDPFTEGERLYRSGDRCAYLPDGNLDFLGRLDSQVKVRGHRIEPGEIEASIAGYPGVTACAVTPRKDVQRGDVLVAWFTGDNYLQPEAIRVALAHTLPPYMVPNLLFRVDSLPLLDSGKVNRGALSIRPLPEVSQSQAVETAGSGFKRDVVELIAQAMAELLGLQHVGNNDDFFALGGHSLLAMQLIARIEALLRRRISAALLFQTATPETIASFLREESICLPQRLLPLRTSGALQPIFFVHLLLDGSIHDYLALVRSLDPNLPIYALCPGGFDLSKKPFWSLNEIAAEYITEIKQLRPSGTYHLCGYSSAGILAFEMARQLRQSGDQVNLFLLDSFPPATISSLSIQEMFNMAGVFARSRGKRGITLRMLRRAAKGLRETMMRLVERSYKPSRQIEDQDQALVAMLNRAMNTHRSRPYPGKAILFKAQQEGRYSRFNFDGLNNWRRLVLGGIELRVIPGNHRQIMQHPSVDLLAGQLQESLEEDSPAR